MKRRKSIQEDHLHDSTSQITTNEKSLYEEIQIVDKVLNFNDPFEIHCSNYGREIGIEPKIEVMHAQLTFIPMARIWWNRQ